MVRSKMPRVDRAKQFAPFDALKGLQDALRVKEFEHESLWVCNECFKELNKFDEV